MNALSFDFFRTPRVLRMCGLASAALCATALGGCADIPMRNSFAGIGLLTAAHLPTSQVNQVYYLGVFDPRDQVPPTIYRVRVRGQASALSAAKFASGWVHASLVDSLGTSGKFNEQTAGLNGKTAIASATEDKSALTGRRLIMFGPEGFREAPKDHRLVVVMGSDPSAFFQAVDSALGAVAEVTQGTTVPAEIHSQLWAELARVRSEQRLLDDVKTSLQTQDQLAGVSK